MPKVTPAQMIARLNALLMRFGFSARNADALAQQLVAAEAMGQPGVGVAHVFDYLGGIERGQIDGKAEPVLSRPAPAILSVDGQGGVPQRGFDAAVDLLIDTARAQGVGLFLHRNATLCGALGTYALRLAEAGLASFAATNGSAIMGGSGTRRRVFSTNPLAFALPGPEGPTLMIDQSSSATALVNIRQAAQDGTDIPPGWAKDANGAETADPAAAMAGMLLPFGGERGSNIALLVECLAAGLTGAEWSVDASSFATGTHSPATGLFVLAIAPERSGSGLTQRSAEHVERLAKSYGLHIPGQAKLAARKSAQAGIEIPQDLLDKLEQI